MRAKNSWIWRASGKHPIAADYFQLGATDPLLQAFDEWVDAGFRHWTGSQKNRPANHSWRFWAKGHAKKTLICGVGRDSSDRIGRIYPLLLLGAGPLSGWESNWDLLPYALEDTWRQMEQLSTKRVLDIRHLEEGLATISIPRDNWKELRIQHKLGDGRPGDITRDLEPIWTQLGFLSRQADGMVSFSNGSHDAQQQQLALSHRLLKERLKAVPNAVFIGGVPEKTCLALFRRPLRVEDFTSLWTV